MKGADKMNTQDCILFKDLEVAKHFNLLSERLENTAKLLWDVDGDKCYEFLSGATLVIWHNGICEFEADGIILALRN